MVRWTTPAALILAAALVGAPEARADTMKWDQAKVTAVAGELVDKTRNIRDSVRRQPPPTLGQAGMRSFHRLRDDLSAIQSTAVRLHNALQAGSSQAETFPTYRRLISLVRSASQELNRMQLGEPAAGQIKAAGEVLSRLRPFYEEAPPV